MLEVFIRFSFAVDIKSDILKPWITPSVFESTGNDMIVDEYTLGQYLDSGTAESILKNHWETVSVFFPYYSLVSYTALVSG